MRLRGGQGTLMVLASAASFGTLPVLVKFAYSTGLTPLFVTLALAATLLGDRLTPDQLLGAAAVVLAVVIVHLPPEAREAPD